MAVVIDALDVSDRAAFGLAGLAGYRAGELNGQLVDDVVLDGETYQLGATVADCARLIVCAGCDAIDVEAVGPA